jgi:hypothetical protein
VRRTSIDSQIARLRVATEELSLAEVARENALNALAHTLGPAIKAWQSVEPPGCGHTGGWTLYGVTGQPNTRARTVHLRHECFYAHQYDRYEVYATEVDLTRLLEAAEVSSRG